MEFITSNPHSCVRASQWRAQSTISQDAYARVEHPARWIPRDESRYRNGAMARSRDSNRQVNRLDAWLRDRSQSVKPRCNRDDATRGRVRGCVLCRNRATRLSRFFSRPRVFVLLSSWVAVSSRTYRRHIRFVVRGFRLCPAFVDRTSKS